MSVNDVNRLINSIFYVSPFTKDNEGNKRDIISFIFANINVANQN